MKWQLSLDKVGAVLSFTCAVHCLLAPFVLVALPVGGLAYALNETGENVVTVTAIGLAAVSLGVGYLTHRRYRTLLIMAAAVAIILLAKTGLEGHAEATAMVAGGSLLALAHVINLRLCRACRHCH